MYFFSVKMHAQFSHLKSVEILCRSKRAMRFSCAAQLRTFLFGEIFMSEVFAENLRRFGTEKGYTQEDLAKLLNINRTTLTKYETDVTEPDFERLKLICELLDVDYNTILQK